MTQTIYKMKKQFTKLQFEKFESKLKKKGYIRYNESVHNEDYYWFKRIIRNEETNRTTCSLAIAVYDFSKYPQFREPTPMHIEFRAHISRNSDERIETLIMSDKLATIEAHEALALSIYTLIMVEV